MQNVNRIEAAVLIAHGQNDIVVRSKNFDQWWEVLKINDTPSKMWLSFGGHVFEESQEWNLEVNKWLDHWLYGIENGVMEGPVVYMESNNLMWTELDDWPHVNANPVTFHLTTEGKLQTEATENGSEGNQTFQDGEDMWKSTTLHHLLKPINRIDSSI